jgi:hypothetical protein
MYIPANKKMLLSWFAKNRPAFKRSKLKAMTKKQLYAIYFAVRGV